VVGEHLSSKSVLHKFVGVVKQLELGFCLGVGKSSVC
jgi:hypothetical protein